MKKIKIVKKTILEKTDVYDISVSDHKHYILENGIVSHNSGLKYAASIIVFLSKIKAKDEDRTVSGLVLTATSWKNRYARPFSQVKLLLDFSHGLHPYYGLQGDKKADKAQTLTNFCDPLLTKDSITGDSWTLRGKKTSTVDLFKKSHVWSDDLLSLANKNLKDEFSFGSDEVLPDEDDEIED